MTAIYGDAPPTEAARVHGLLEMDLTRHHSNPLTNLQALLDGVLGALNELDRVEHGPDQPLFAAVPPGLCLPSDHPADPEAASGPPGVLEARGRCKTNSI